LVSCQSLTDLGVVLQISDEWVKRLLVNSSSIERLYLAKDFNEADSLLLAQGAGVAITANLLTVTRWRGSVSQTTLLPNLILILNQ
jgi:hypothetical protein